MFVETYSYIKIHSEEANSKELIMNILFLSTRLPYPPNNGHFQRTFNIISHLSKKHDIYLVSFYLKDQSEKIRKTYNDEMEKICKECHTFFIPLEKSKIKLLLTLIKTILFRKPLIGYKYYSNEVVHCINSIKNRIAIDFVHYDMLPMAEYKYLVSDINCLLTEHNVEYLRYLRWIEKEKNIIKKIYIKKQYEDLKQYETNTIKKFKTCVVMSKYDQSILEKYATNTTFKIIPNGTDTEYFKPEISRHDVKSLIWVGGMIQWPNIDAVEYFVTEVFPLIIAKDPDIIFNVVGADPIKILYKSKYANNIRVHGFVDDIRPIVSASNIYVAPIRIGSGTKLKILDAMAMGKCVVTTSVGLEGIDANVGSDIFVCDTPNEFAKMVLKLLSDTELVRKTGENARNLIMNRYSWDRIFADMDSLYE